MPISLLHTIAANQPVFDQAAHELDIPAGQLHHVNLSTLREAVVAAGGFTDELRFQLRNQLQVLAAQSDAILVTCATLGAAVDGMADIAVPVIRADAALARAATAQSGRLTVLCAAQAALPGVQALFCAQEKSAELITVTHVPVVWRFFIEGDTERCHASITTAIEEAYADGADVVALAHPWMAATPTSVQGRQTFDVARAAFAELLAAPRLHWR
ncbi:arylsulfatase [Herbaspirillum rubrisubalbicans Os34]|uniref:Arylsulfatase n=1 Tax=Herbaspirillum rubrisubalbicans Os34 TaxID=1235827 RepID=A0A6M3ZX55_9BURK|nr:hypothetical protein [Herbaspirillum rubrisubalbicans]QJQ02480.1 arylsulfatase [Herbaspirillum rubrisubalbicans Os34]